MTTESDAFDSSFDEDPVAQEEPTEEAREDAEFSAEPAEEVAVEEASEAETEEEVVDWQARYAVLEHKTKSWEGRLSASDREREKLRKEKEELETRLTSAPAESGDSDTEDDADSFYTDFPELKNVLSKEREQIRKELLSEFDHRLAPLQEREEQKQVEKHYAAIAEVHPDWEELTEDLTSYIEKQPPYIAEGMRRVVATGSADEAIDLLTRYKRDNGRDTATNKRNQQAKAAAAVTSRSGSPVKRASRDDYDGAWDEAPD